MKASIEDVRPCLFVSPGPGCCKEKWRGVSLQNIPSICPNSKNKMRSDMIASFSQEPNGKSGSIAAAVAASAPPEVMVLYERAATACHIYICIYSDHHTLRVLVQASPNSSTGCMSRYGNGAGQLFVCGECHHFSLPRSTAEVLSSTPHNTRVLSPWLKSLLALTAWSPRARARVLVLVLECT